MSEAVAGKICSRCQEWKIFDEFYPRADGAGGRRAVCRTCDLADSRNRRMASPLFQERECQRIAAAEMIAQGQKRCKKCKSTYPMNDENFHFYYVTDRDGSRRKIHHGVCRTCRIASDSAVRNARRRKRRAEGKSENKGKPERYAVLRARFASNREYINAYKMEVGCMDCGYKGHPCALDFDHKESAAKVGNISKLRICQRSKIDEEIRKCEVVCANCHRIRTLNRMNMSDDYPLR